MNNINVGDYVFLNSLDDMDNEEISLYQVSDISELGNDTITITATHNMTPQYGDGIICRNDGTSFLPTSLDGLSQQMIDYARNIDLNIFANQILARLNGVSKTIFWHYTETASYLSNVDIEITNEGTTYYIDVPENGIVSTVTFELSELGEVIEIEEDYTAYSIVIDFDKNQSFTPNKEFAFVNNKPEVCGTLPEICLISLEDNTARICDIVYPVLIDYHTVSLRFSSSVKTDANTLLVRLTF